MDRQTERNLSIHSKSSDKENVKTIEWEDLDQELTRLCSLSSALKEAKDKKQGLQNKLESLIQVNAESLSRSNKLEEMRERLETKKLAMGNRSMNCKVAEQGAKKKEESLSTEVRSLLVAGTSLSVAKNQLRESNRLLGGDKGFARLAAMLNKLRKRQQYMISQVSCLFPVKIVVGPRQEQELEAIPGASNLGNTVESKPVSHGSLTILGLRLTMAPFTKMSLFTDKKEVQRSATALGYVAQAVLLIASYLKIPLRYPLRLGGSRSYIRDYAPSLESSSSSDQSSNALPSRTVKFVEFPLFLDGQDTTRSAYAVFLLNKDIEQLLNFAGANSLGPRHVLTNLKELIRTVQSPDFLDT